MITIKSLLSLLFFVFIAFSASLQRVDSVTVDSVWVSDSASRISRDCKVSFKPIGIDTVEIKSVTLSVDSGLTWSFSPDSVAVLNGGLSAKYICAEKATVLVRILGGDRSNVAVKVTVRQEKLFSNTFAIPIWDPEARWQLDPKPFSGFGSGSNSQVNGELGGPRQEVMLGAFYPKVFTRYDHSTERIHVVAYRSFGYLDGPFSRARTRGGSYSNYSRPGVSPDGRYRVEADPGNGYAIRVMDFATNMVSTLTVPNGLTVQSLVVDSKGQVVIFGSGRVVTIGIATNTVVSDITLKATQGLSLGAGKGLALDEVHNKLYASGTCDGGWHVWYFDLNDGGSFHGVLSGGARGANGGYAGPFDTYAGYCEQNIWWGPDDPERRFLYMAVTDEPGPKRLDLQNRMVAIFSVDPNNPNLLMFSESSTFIPASFIGFSLLPGAWLPDGSNISSAGSLFRRVK